jgi:hypothetical protein
MASEERTVLDNMERRALGAALVVEGCNDLKAAIIPKYHDALDRLIAKGLIRPVWTLTDEAREILAGADA